MPAHHPTTRRLRRLLSLLLLPAILLSGFPLHAPAARAQAAPPRYTAQVLEGPQGEWFNAVDLNNTGQVLGALDTGPDDIPAIWQGGQLTQLPQMADEGGAYYPRPSALNDAGQALVYDRSYLYIWNGSYSRIALEPRFWWNTSYLSAAEINNRGTVFAAINDSTTPSTKWTATLWNSGAFFYLPAPDGSTAAITADLNDSGRAVGAFSLSGRFQPFRIVDNVALPLAAPGGRSPVPSAINSQGQIVGSSFDTLGRQRPQIWQADGTPADLPTNGAYGSAVDINDRGDMLGFLEGVGVVLWTQGTFYPVANLIPAELSLSLFNPLALNNDGQILLRGRLPGQDSRFYLLSPAAEAVTLESLTLQRQDRESAAWVDLPDPANLADGHPLRAVAKIRNPGDAAQRVTVAFRNKTSGLGFPGCVTTVEVPPTGDGEPYAARCEIDTAGLAWTVKDSPIPGARHVVEAEITLPDATAQQAEKPVTVRPRPVIFVPGIAGNYARNPGLEGDMEWLLNRGISPGKLEIDPLIRSYDGILRTLFNAGYTPGRDLFIANYDWRLVPGPSDRVYDGVVSGLTAAGIADSRYRYGVDYLGESLRVAAEVWQAAYTIPLDDVDVIAHSTGGLVTRTYIQSTAYGEEYAAGARLPKVRNFISVGVPHRGASKAWNPLHDNWGIDTGFRAVLSKIVNRAFQKIDGGAGNVRIAGPDYDITLLDVRNPDGTPAPIPFIRKYLPTINTLLATYPFMDRGGGVFDDANDGNLANHLVLDLNNGADVIAGRDPNLFLARTRLTAIGGVNPDEETPLYVRQRLGPARFVLAPFTDFLPANAGEGEVYFEDVRVALGGDGTVPTISGVGQFQGDPRARVLTFQKGLNTVADVGHTDLTDNPDIQRAILETLDVPVYPEDLVALGREDVENITSVILDPVQGYVVDGQGRRLGWTEATGPLAEIPNSLWRGAGDGFGLIFGPVSGELRLELRGMDGPYYAQVQRVTADGQLGGVTLRGDSLGRDQTLSAPALLPTQVYLPMVSPGGPYRVAEGASVPLSAGGDAGLRFAWDLDGDGAFETDGPSASFSAAGIDGPARRAVAVRGGLPTGQSAVATAEVTIENSAPTATFIAPSSAAAGRPFSISLAGASDAGGDPLSFAFDCGAGFGQPGGAPSASCTVAAAGTVTVQARVADDDGGSTVYRADVAITDGGGAPACPVLDRFDRQGPRLGGGWVDTQNGYVLENNRVRVTTGGPAYLPAVYGADQAACIELSQIARRGQHHTLMLKLQDGSWAKGAILVSYNAGNRSVVVESRDVARNRWRINGRYRLAEPLGAGANLLAHARADGSVAVYVNGALVGTTPPIPFYAEKGGQIGVFYQRTPGQFDAFGGGTR